ncbi:MAG: Crp/Fnr family transcriptional regulator [Candidatus Limnocylindrales bacterium]
MDPGASTLLDGTWFATELPPSVRRELLRIARLEEFGPGVTVVRPGEPCPALGLIADGRIALRLAVPGRDPRTIQTLEPGDIFGWSAVLEGTSATSLAVTLLPTRAFLLDRVPLAAAMAGDHELAAAVYRLVLGAVARRLQATRLQLLDLYRAEGEPW